MHKISNIFITGGAGYIGSHIVEQLIETKAKAKAKIIILDNLVTGYKRLVNKKAIFIKGDIKEKNKLSDIINDYKIDSIIHLAASLNIDEAEKNKKKYYENNITGTLNLVHACKKSMVRNFIFSSSCSIYGNVKGSVDESKKPKPIGYYAYTKYKSEETIKRYALKYNYQYGILRYFNVAGASSSGKIGEINKSHGHLIKNLSIQTIKKKPQISIYGNDYNTKDGTCIRDYIHVSDLSDIHIKTLKYINSKIESLTLNCGYGKGYSVLDIVKIFKKNNPKMIVTYQPRRRGDVTQIYSNTKKIKKILKWKPKYNNIKKIIKSAIKWEKSV